MLFKFTTMNNYCKIISAKVYRASSFIYWKYLINRSNGRVDWDYAATKDDRPGSRSGHIPKTWKRALAPCPASALTGGCKVAVHARCCHWFTNSSAFTAKPAAQGSGNGRRRSLAKGGQKPSMNETELKYPISMAWLLLSASCYFRPLRHNVLLHRCPH